MKLIQTKNFLSYTLTFGVYMLTVLNKDPLGNLYLFAFLWVTHVLSNAMKKL